MISNINITTTKILSKNKYTLSKIEYEYDKPDGSSNKQSREVYDRGNAVAILLYNAEHKTVILTKQFRLPAFLNGSATGMLTEVCAGMLEDEDAQQGIIREVKEETGYEIKEVQKVMEAYMSPGSVTELIYFFIARYDSDMKVAEGGGAKGEEENIDVIEIPFHEAFQQIGSGEIKDAKTIMLLQYAKLNNIM